MQPKPDSASEYLDVSAVYDCERFSVGMGWESR